MQSPPSRTYVRKHLVFVLLVAVRNVAPETFAKLGPDPRALHRNIPEISTKVLTGEDCGRGLLELLAAGDCGNLCAFAPVELHAGVAEAALGLGGGMPLSFGVVLSAPTSEP